MTNRFNKNLFEGLEQMRSYKQKLGMRPEAHDIYLDTIRQACGPSFLESYAKLHKHSTLNDLNSLFLTAIIHKPDDDLLRLVYADLLEENGQAERAEFIRVQCALATLPKQNPHWHDLKLREHKLLEKHKDEWTPDALKPHTGTSRAVISDVTFARGFIEEIKPLLPNASPYHKSLYLARLWQDCSKHSPLRALDMSQCGHSDHIELLQRHKAKYSALESLTLPHFFSHLDIGTLADNFPALQSLTVLRNRGINNCSQSVVRTLAQHAAKFTALRSLKILNFNDVDIQAWAEYSPQFPALQSLDMSSNAIHNIRILADHAGKLPTLQSLHLRLNSSDDVQTLVNEREKFPTLESLNLSDKNIYDKDLQALAEAAGKFPTLQKISLAFTYITSNGVEALAKHAANFLALQKLNISHNDIGERGLKALARANFPALKDLDCYPADYHYSIEPFIEELKQVREQQIQRGLPITMPNLATINGEPLSYYGIPPAPAPPSPVVGEEGRNRER